MSLKVYVSRYSIEKAASYTDTVLFNTRYSTCPGVCSSVSVLKLTYHPGVKAAAIRKLPHELGVKPEELKMDDFTFLTRIHYLAPSDGLWGEHEGKSLKSCFDCNILSK